MRYYFYPFDDSKKLKFMDAFAKSLGYNAGTLATPKIGLILADNGEYVSSLASAVAADEIYVMGHTSSALKVLGDADHGNIDQTEITRRIKLVGLPATVSCKILLYACFSGQGGRSSLAAMVASSLKIEKFVCSANVYGITKKVSTRAHEGKLCVLVGENSWEDIAFHDYAIVHHLPNH